MIRYKSGSDYEDYRIICLLRNIQRTKTITCLKINSYCGAFYRDVIRRRSNLHKNLILIHILSVCYSHVYLYYAKNEWTTMEF